MISGRTIRMHLVDGTVSGLITAEIMNWMGHVVLSPRSRLMALLARAEARRRLLFSSVLQMGATHGSLRRRRNLSARGRVRS